jgi:hypothetical protein
MKYGGSCAFGTDGKPEPWRALTSFRMLPAWALPLKLQTTTQNASESRAAARLFDMPGLPSNTTYSSQWVKKGVKRLHACSSYSIFDCGPHSPS